MKMFNPETADRVTAGRATVGRATVGRAEEDTLVRAAKEGDSAALETLTARHAPLVRGLSARFYRSAQAALSREELVQSGYMGLLLALARYDEASDAAFGTYALAWILGEMRRTVKSAVNMTGGYEQIARLKRKQSAFEAANGRSPTVEELAALCGETPWQVAQLTYMASVVRYESEEASGGGEETIADGRENPEEQIDIKLALDALPREERQVILLRYYRDWTQAETARAVGKSQAQISRMERRAIDRMKALLT